MKTKRLYYNDPYLFEFDAHVVEVHDIDGRYGVIMDRTAFYPTSGGQPNDLGLLDRAPVLDVYEDESSGAVVHVVKERVQPGPIHGLVDAARRRDHIQQHSGQHVLSRAFVQLYNLDTVGFHMGETTSTIDLNSDVVPAEQLAAAEDEANRAILENRPVQVCYLHQGLAADAGLRKPSERQGEIRVIDIQGFDRSACGGTHVRMTGEIGPVLILGTERVRKQSRIHFVCGQRAVRYAREANRALERIGQILSVGPMDSAEAARSLWEEHQRTRKHVEELETRLIEYEAAELTAENGIVARTYRGRGIEAIKQLASKVCARPDVLALLADESDQLRVVFARSADGSIDVAVLLKKVLERFGGRGGGRPNFAQAGGLQTSAAEALEFAKGLL